MVSRRSAWAATWPWLVLLTAALPAIWYVVDHESDLDGEYPTVVRPTFNRFPPAAYRVAEPGDTLDRLALYAAATATVIAAIGGHRQFRATGRAGFWPGAAAVSLAALWFAMTPGPLPDGWHGLGWGAILDPRAPGGMRIALAVAAGGLLAAVVGSRVWRLATEAQSTRRGLLAAALLLVGLRPLDLSAAGPPGYWPRCAFFLGLLAWTMALMRGLPPRPAGLRWRRSMASLAACAVVAALVLGGRMMLWYQRPLDRLRTIVPGRLYISAMPNRRGLELAQQRHHFRTIINLFPEDTPLRSPRVAEEEAFVRERGLRYLRNTTFATDPDRFLDATLALARDPASWPVLVHCHACMDRTPAWVGIYRFAEEGQPLARVFQEIERHRGLRPKATVTLMYARQLPRLAPARFAADPVAPILLHCAEPALAEYLRRSPPSPQVGAEAATARR